MGCTTSRAKPFGGDLNIMWALNPEIPQILILCGKFLELPPASIQRGLFCSGGRLGDTKPSEPGVLEALRQDPSYDPRVLAIKRFRSLTNIHRTQSIPWATIVDPLVVAGLYKLFFRQLTPPLLTFHLHDKWIAAQQHDNELAYVVSMRALFLALPEAHQVVLVHALDLFDILIRPKNQKKNGLSIEHVAMEFGPLFLRPLRSGEGARGAQPDTIGAVKCLKSMLTMRTHIFERTNETEFVKLSRDNDRYDGCRCRMLEAVVVFCLGFEGGGVRRYTMCG